MRIYIREPNEIITPEELLKTGKKIIGLCITPSGDAAHYLFQCISRENTQTKETITQLMRCPIRRMRNENNETTSTMMNVGFYYDTKNNVFSPTPSPLLPSDQDKLDETNFFTTEEIADIRSHEREIASKKDEDRSDSPDIEGSDHDHSDTEMTKKEEILLDFFSLTLGLQRNAANTSNIIDILRSDHFNDAAIFQELYLITTDLIETTVSGSTTELTIYTELYKNLFAFYPRNSAADNEHWKNVFLNILYITENCLIIFLKYEDWHNIISQDPRILPDGKALLMDTLKFLEDSDQSEINKSIIINLLCTLKRLHCDFSFEEAQKLIQLKLNDQSILFYIAQSLNLRERKNPLQLILLVTTFLENNHLMPDTYNDDIRFKYALGDLKADWRSENPFIELIKALCSINDAHIPFQTHFNLFKKCVFPVALSHAQIILHNANLLNAQTHHLLYELDSKLAFNKNLIRSYDQPIILCQRVAKAFCILD
jgi:hypothetical protein